MYPEWLGWICMLYAIFSKLNVQPIAILEVTKKCGDGRKLAQGEEVDCWWRLKTANQVFTWLSDKWEGVCNKYLKENKEAVATQWCE